MTSVTTLAERHLVRLPVDASVDPDPSAAEDDDLLLRVSRRDQAAFRELLHRHLGPVHAYLNRMTRSPSDAEDLAQETFLRVWQKASSYRPGKVRATTWIHRIAHNLSVDRFRRGHARAAPRTAEQIDEPEDPAADPYLHQAALQLREHLEVALMALPDNQRAAIVLCQMQGLSNSEAAQVLGVRVRAVESLLARARRTLRSTLTDPQSQ